MARAKDAGPAAKGKAARKTGRNTASPAADKVAREAEGTAPKPAGRRPAAGGAGARMRTEPGARAEASERKRPSPADPLPVGEALDRLPTGRRPDGRMLYGRTVTLEPIDPARHGEALYEASHGKNDPHGRIWTYMAYGPWVDYLAFRDWLEAQARSRDPLFFAIVPRITRKASGMAAYMNIRPEAGVLEIGSIWFAPVLQKTREATEAIYLLMRHAFEELGIRRLEWKCDSLNAGSRAAALRFGFTFEGIFRKHMVVKGRNRDTAWFSMTDDEWPSRRAEFLRWLDDDNFDATGRQKTALAMPPVQP
jgi:RimJ/RimL family protein N-acetyltransferase